MRYLTKIAKIKKLIRIDSQHELELMRKFRNALSIGLNERRKTKKSKNYAMWSPIILCTVSINLLRNLLSLFAIERIIKSLITFTLCKCI